MTELETWVPLTDEPERRWPGPSRPPKPGVLLAVVGAALVAAVTLPLDKPGLGWLLTGAAVAGVAGAVGLRDGRTGWRAVLPDWRGLRLAPVERLGWAAASVALLSVGTFRAAGWLFVICVLTACVTGAFATVGGRTLAGLVLSVPVVPAAAIRAIPWGARGARAISRTGRGGSAMRLTASVAVGGLLVVIFGALFAGADAAFRGLLNNAFSVFGGLDGTGVARGIFCFGLAGLGTLGGCYLVAAPPTVDLRPDPARGVRGLRLREWAVPLALLDALFASFVLIQLTVLFGGRTHVLGTENLTYAEYARGGFWQLVTVTVLTLGVIALAVRLAGRGSAAERLWLRILLGTLSVLTLVIVASALKRLALYESTYGYTRLRILVGACEIWLAIVFVLVLVAGIRLRAPWLARAVAGTAVAMVLAIAVLNPDRFIADRNVDRYQSSHRIDLYYLERLSPDAAPALARLPEPMREQVLASIYFELYDQCDDWSDFNLGRQRARETVAGLKLAKESPPSC
jgi:hypothetical protein